MTDFFYSLFGRAALAIEFNPDNVLEGADLSTQDPVVTVLNVIQIGLGVLGLVFVVLVIVGGFLWMTSAGNQERIKKARNLLIAAIIGLAVVLGSYGMSEYVFNALYNATEGAPVQTQQEEDLAPCNDKEAGDPCGTNMVCNSAGDCVEITAENVCFYNKQDGETCGDNMVCLMMNCVTMCEYEASQYPETMRGYDCRPIESCNKWEEEMTSGEVFDTVDECGMEGTWCQTRLCPTTTTDVCCYAI